MILIITHRLDFTADFVINKLNELKIPYKRFNCEDLLTYDLTLNIDSEFHYNLMNEDEYKSIWFRRTKLPSLNNIENSTDKSYILNEVDSFFNNLWNTIDTNWLSIPSNIYKAENKMFQLKVAKSIGFNIPPTMVTTSKEDLVNFHKAYNDIIIKPLSHTRINNNNSLSFIFTNKLDDKYLTSIDEYLLTPCIFQKRIDKEYELRITVVDEEVFVAGVDSQSNDKTKYDWRREKITFHEVGLPDELKSMCVELVQTLGLKFGAIDMIKSKSGEYVFLEINPNGQWAWIESETGLKISDSIINYLNN